jgi:hypothetical protein
MWGCHVWRSWPPACPGLMSLIMAAEIAGWSEDSWSHDRLCLQTVGSAEGLECRSPSSTACEKPPSTIRLWRCLSSEAVGEGGVPHDRCPPWRRKQLRPDGGRQFGSATTRARLGGTHNMLRRLHRVLPLATDHIRKDYRACNPKCSSRSHNINIRPKNHLGIMQQQMQLYTNNTLRDTIAPLGNIPMLMIL